MNIGDVIYYTCIIIRFLLLCCVVLYLDILFASFIIRLLADKNDPVHNCRLYREQGCSYVDSMLCDFPYCEMNKQYIKEKEDESKSN